MANRLIKSILKPVILKKNEKYLKNYYQKISNEENIAEDEIPKDKNILIISPHQDDESIGMGGTILKLKENNCYIKVLYITDGRLDRENLDENEISKVRIKEAEKALKILGVDEFSYLKCKNCEVMDNIENISYELIPIIEEKDYDRIYTTALSEYHKDHRGATIALSKALEKCDFSGKIYLYEINNSLMKGSFNRYVSFSKEIYNKKEKAFMEYKSQTGINFEVVEMIGKGKAQLSREKDDSAEIFLEINKENLKKSANENLEVFDNMKNATNFFRLIDNYNNNEKYVSKIKELYTNN